jgi:hypothetical protein
MLEPKDCQPGYTFRKAHMRKPRSRHTTRRHGKLQLVAPSEAPVHVPASCIKTRKKRTTISKSADILRKEPLIQYGYQWRRPDAKRKAALKQAIKHTSVPIVYNKLLAITGLMKKYAHKSHTIKDMYLRFKMDRDWIRAQYPTFLSQ